MTKPEDPRTVAVTSGIASDTSFGAVTPPIYLTSTFAFSPVSNASRGRTAHPAAKTTTGRSARLESCQVDALLDLALPG